MDEQWYFVEEGQRAGPIAKSELADMAAHRMIDAQTLVWTDGMADWEEAGRHFSFAGSSASVPPPLQPATGPSPAASSADDDTLGFPLSSRSAPADARTDGARGGIGPDGLYVGAPSRGFGQAIAVCFGKYVTFSGRASRSEYWFFYLFVILVSFAASILDTILVGAMGSFSPINAIASLVLFLPGLSASVRRLHDTDRSGWWIGSVYLVMLVLVVFGFTMAFGVRVGSAIDDGLFILVFGVGGIVIVGYMILLLVFLCSRGTLGPNRFG